MWLVSVSVLCLNDWKTLVLVYFWVRGSNVHETVMFDIISRILVRRTVAGRVPWLVGRLCIFLICAVLVKLTFPTH